MSDAAGRDPLLEDSRKKAEDAELRATPDSELLLEREREEAQGVEVFEDPDATIPGSALAEGSTGHESLTADAVGLRGDDDDRRAGGGPEES